jgi:hypothetical protein
MGKQPRVRGPTTRSQPWLPVAATLMYCQVGSLQPPSLPRAAVRCVLRAWAGLLLHGDGQGTMSAHLHRPLSLRRRGARASRVVSAHGYSLISTPIPRRTLLLVQGLLAPHPSPLASCVPLWSGPPASSTYCPLVSDKTLIAPPHGTCPLLVLLLLPASTSSIHGSGIGYSRRPPTRVTTRTVYQLAHLDTKRIRNPAPDAEYTRSPRTNLHHTPTKSIPRGHALVSDEQ